MKYTPFDIVSISFFLVVGTVTLGLGLILSERLELSLAIWVHIISCMVFALNLAMASVTVDKICGKRSELGKEIDALGKRVDKTCPLSFALSLNEEIDELRMRVDALERGVEE